jgi:peptidyl-prolyl cis-trans isomerase SurA
MATMKRSIAAMLVGGMASVSLWAQTASVDGILVVVNDALITWADVAGSIEQADLLLQQQYRNQPEVYKQKFQALQRERTEALVEQELILHDFETSGFKIPESIIEDEIQKRIREEYADRTQLAKTLQAEGITNETYRKRIREKIIIEAMSHKNVSEELIISPHKIELFYQQNQDKFKVEDQVKLRMIVLNKSKDSPETARNLAQDIFRKLNEGTTFADMASIYSEGSQKSQGGDWGWVDRSVLRKELVDTAFSLKPGQRSGVIETPEACWIMMLEDTRAAHTKTLSEVRSDIEKTLVAQERARLYKKWIERLKAKSFVRYF